MYSIVYIVYENIYAYIFNDWQTNMRLTIYLLHIHRSIF